MKKMPIKDHVIKLKNKKGVIVDYVRDSSKATSNESPNKILNMKQQ